MDATSWWGSVAAANNRQRGATAAVCQPVYQVVRCRQGVIAPRGASALGMARDLLGDTLQPDSPSPARRANLKDRVVQALPQGTSNG